MKKKEMTVRKSPEVIKKTSEMRRKESAQEERKLKEERNELTEKFRRVTGKVGQDHDKLRGTKKSGEEGVVKMMRRKFEKVGNGEEENLVEKSEAGVRKKVAKFESIVKNHEKISEKDRGGGVRSVLLAFR